MNEINTLTIEDIGGSDCEVWLKKNDRFGFDLEIESEDLGAYIHKGLHPFAAESMADFCRRFLQCYDKIGASLD
jgi:hypothetical protein